MIVPAQASEKTGFQFRRMPALPRKIKDISPENDIRVRLFGRVIDKYDSTIVIDDGTAKAEVVADGANVAFADIASGGFVRIFARVLPLESGYELRAEIVQPMTEGDMELHKKICG